MSNVDFQIMGFDENTNDFLNWALKYRDNLEYMKNMKTLELTSAKAELYFSPLGKINRIDRNLVDRRG